jgi:hypothetical protein
MKSPPGRWTLTRRPVAYASSIAVWRGRYVSSGNASRTGIPRPSLGERPSASSSVHSMTCSGPRNRTMAAISDPQYLPADARILSLIVGSVNASFTALAIPGSVARTPPSTEPGSACLA